MTEKEYTEVQALTNLRAARKCLAEIVPEFLPAPHAGDFRVACRFLAEIEDGLAQLLKTGG